MRLAVLGLADHSGVDQVADRFARGHVADSDLIGDLTLAGHRAVQIVAMFDPVFQDLCNFKVFCHTAFFKTIFIALML